MHDLVDIETSSDLDRGGVRVVAQGLSGALFHLLPERFVGQVLPVRLVVHGLAQGLRCSQEDRNPTRRVLPELDDG